MADVEMLQISINYKGTDYIVSVDIETANILLNDQNEAERYILDAFPELITENNENTCEPSTSKRKVWHFKGRPTKNDDEATMLLLELRQKYDDKFNDSKTTNNSLWTLIAKEIEAQGFDICPTKSGPAIKCRQKFVNLENQYIAYIKHMRQTGEEKKSPPPYYDILHAILGRKDKINPQNLQDTEESIGSTHVSHVTEECERLVEASEYTSDCEDAPEEGVMSKEDKKKQVINRFSNVKRTVRPKSMASQLLAEMKRQHENDQDNRTEQYRDMKELLREQNDHRRQMVDLFSSLVTHIKKSGPKKRKRSSSESSD